MQGRAWRGIITGLLAGWPRPRPTDKTRTSMDFLISSAYAQAGDAAAQPNPLLSFLPLLVLFGVFYFMLIRPQMKRAKEQRNMISALAKGDEVVTNGGMAGRIEDIGDTFVTLEIATGVRIKLQKSAISLVLPKGSLKSS
jgi:preprotein translocase subunit YajC